MSAESTEADSGVRRFFEERYEKIIAGIADDIRRRQADGELSADLHPEAVASLLVAAADGLQLQWLLDPGRMDMGERLSQFWDALRGSSSRT
jgi:hypothetical protein